MKSQTLYKHVTYSKDPRQLLSYPIGIEKLFLESDTPKSRQEAITVLTELGLKTGFYKIGDDVSGQGTIYLDYFNKDKELAAYENDFYDEGEHRGIYLCSKPSILVFDDFSYIQGAFKDQAITLAQDVTERDIQEIIELISSDNTLKNRYVRRQRLVSPLDSIPGH